MIRIAFPLVGGAHWTGGISYMSNLLAALREFAADEIEPILFVETEADLAALAPLAGLYTRPPIVIERSTGHSRRWRRPWSRALLQRDVGLESALRAAGADVVFQTSEWFGFRFGLPTLVWIPDLQHGHLPQMFSRRAWLKRDLGYRSLVRSATRIMLSSEDARQDCERFYPRAVGKCSVVPFAVRTGAWADAEALADVRARHALPERFFYLPNQLWKHKNHRLVIDAVVRLKQEGRPVCVVSSGNMVDGGNPTFPQSVVDHVRAVGADDVFRFLGMVPRDDIPRLMQASLAVINPSLFEGWSTVVEEAKSLGVRLLLSDLRVHREQAPALGSFFDPHDVAGLAKLLAEVSALPAQPLDQRHHDQSRQRNEAARATYARTFVAVCETTRAAFRHGNRG